MATATEAQKMREFVERLSRTRCEQGRGTPGRRYWDVDVPGHRTIRTTDMEMVFLVHRIAERARGVMDEATNQGEATVPNEITADRIVLGVEVLPRNVVRRGTITMKRKPPGRWLHGGGTNELRPA